MEYPKEQIEFLQAIYDMRKSQKDYFRNRNDYRLRVALAKESIVDKLLMPYITGGIVTGDQPSTNQANLF